MDYKNKFDVVICCSVLEHDFYFQKAVDNIYKALKKEFKLENPQIEINEVKDVYLDAQLVAERVAGSLERFGSARFKGVGHKIMANVMNSGAMGIELIISGKIPGARAKSWRFYQGYLKKCGDVSMCGRQCAQVGRRLLFGHHHRRIWAHLSRLTSFRVPRIVTSGTRPRICLREPFA